MLRGREPVDRVVAPPRRPDRDISRLRRGRELGLCLGLLAACSGRSESATSGTQRPAESAPRVDPFSGVGRVGNQVRGIDAIPDYDEQAQALRARVERRLPDPLPSPRAACVAMLDAARQFYVDTEGEGSPAVATINATRDGDLAGCVEQTEPAAAACVAVLMAKSEGEYPWVLDQCSRAFPRAEG